ncbi:MAG: S9 family peptidase [Planctomycetaceae bacterium]
MTDKTTRQYGLWDSPITPRSLAESLRLDAARWDSDGGTLLWLEGRSGRGVLVAETSPRDAPRDLTADLSVRAEVGYGGGDFTVHGGYAYFAVHKDGRLFRQSVQSGEAVPITPKFGSVSSPVVSPDGRFVAFIHHDGEETDVVAVVDSEGKLWPQVFTGGHDFYMQPRWGPDGKRFAWIAWDHPNMPWDGTTLYVAEVVCGEGDGLPSLGEPRAIAGGEDVAIFQPEFTPDGATILYVSDETGWGRLRSTNLETGESKWLTESGYEYGWPAWAQDMRTYAVSHDGAYAIAARGECGFQRLRRIDLRTGDDRPLRGAEAYTEITTIHAAPDSQRVVFVGSAPRIPRRIVEHDVEAGESRIVARSSGETIAATALSECEAVRWETGEEETAYGLYYPPAGDRFEGIGKPPVVALIHGGPTGQGVAAWSPNAQFFATRGYAVLVVNYRGSTGYGREYMLRLRGDWGLCDVEDSISGVKFLADEGRIDPDRTVIMGGSAGGFTVLHALSQFPESFTAGVSLYGVANQFHLASETHKFESRYLDSMLGPLPEAAAKYHERSPQFHAHTIRRPLAVFQGEIDRVVPKAQSDAVAAALARSGTPHIYHCYDGEGHGWRKRETIEHFYNAVDAFLREHVIFA